MLVACNDIAHAWMADRTLQNFFFFNFLPFILFFLELGDKKFQVFEQEVCVRGYKQVEMRGYKQSGSVKAKFNLPTCISWPAQCFKKCSVIWGQGVGDFCHLESG